MFNPTRFQQALWVAFRKTNTPVKGSLQRWNWLVRAARRFVVDHSWAHRGRVMDGKIFVPGSAAALPANTSLRRLGAGVLWGWLPCGLSATLLTAAWFQASASRGALTMLAFGLGTLPVMVPLTWSGARLGQWLQRGPWRTAAGLFVLLAGLLTLSAPWLMQVPGAHGLLTALGCGSLPID